VYVTDAGEHGQQVDVWRPDLAAEELHDAEHFAAQQDWKAECRVQALSCRDRRAGKIRIVDDVGDPGGLPGGPDPAGETGARFERRAAARRIELGEATTLGGPDLRAAEYRCLPIDLPQRGVFPVECLADGREDLRNGVGEGRCFDQRAGDHVLGSKPAFG
jgi:hypothetical protein